LKESSSKFLKIHKVGAECFYAGGRTDRQRDRHDGANSRFSQFCKHSLELWHSDDAERTEYVTGT